MSWLARSIANTLSLNDDDSDDAVSNPHHNSSNARTKPEPSSDERETNHNSSSSPRGVKEDLSELTKTLTSQFWGVASFLAPPPQTEPYKPLNQSDDGKSCQNPDPDQSESVSSGGIRSDFAEIGGRFKSGITKLSTNLNVTEITKMASNFLQLGSEDEEGNSFDSAKGAIGVTEQAVAFARDISMHPEIWLDFPLPEEELEEDFDMSDAQQEHALAVESLAPRLAALRIELCPGYMSEGCFWKIYFVLLHPTLNKQDAELLSTPQVMKARGLFAEGLQNRAKEKIDNKSGEFSVDAKENSSFHHEESLSVPSVPPSEAVSQKTSVPESATSAAVADPSEVVSETIPIPESATSAAIDDSCIDVSQKILIPGPANSSVAADSETEKHPVTSTEVQIVDKSVTEVEQITHPNLSSGTSSTWENKDEDDGDDWLKEEPSEVGDISGTNSIPIENDEDVSFSDLEEDDEDAPTSSKTVSYTSDRDSREWVQL